MSDAPYHPGEEWLNPLIDLLNYWYHNDQKGWRYFLDNLCSSFREFNCYQLLDLVCGPDPTPPILTKEVEFVGPRAVLSALERAYDDPRSPWTSAGLSECQRDSLHTLRQLAIQAARQAIDAKATGLPAPKADQNPKVEWIKNAPLGLTVNTNTRAAMRNGRSVEFDAKGRNWDVFNRLLDRHPNRYLVRDLGRPVWNPKGIDDDPEDNLVQQTISALRRLLKPLGISVNHKRHLGYVLADAGQPVNEK